MQVLIILFPKNGSKFYSIQNKLEHSANKCRRRNDTKSNSPTPSSYLFFLDKVGVLTLCKNRRVHNFVR